MCLFKSDIHEVLGQVCWKIRRQNIFQNKGGWYNTGPRRNLHWPCILSIFPAGAHQFYVNILVLKNVNLFPYINNQFALGAITFSELCASEDITTQFIWLIILDTSSKDPFSQLAVVSDLLTQSSFCISMLSFCKLPKKKKNTYIFSNTQSHHRFEIEYWLLNHHLCILVDT